MQAHEKQKKTKNINMQRTTHRLRKNQSMIPEKHLSG